MITIKHKNRTATIEEIKGPYEVQVRYSVWDPKKGCIASGWRRSFADAAKVANIVLKRG